MLFLNVNSTVMFYIVMFNIRIVNDIYIYIYCDIKPEVS